jgi:AraC-like DNA-binding protein
MRKISSVITNAIVPHKNPFYQILYIEEGELEWYIDGRFYHLFPGDAIIISPNEIQSSLKGNFPVGCHYLVQLKMNQWHPDCGLSEEQLSYMNMLLTEFSPKVIQVGSKGQTVFEHLLDTASFDGEHRAIQMQSGFLMLCSLLQEAIQRSVQESKTSLADAHEIIQRTESYINDHLTSPIKVSDLATQSGLSSAHFRRKFKAISGLSPLEYLNHIKWRAARQRLIETDDSITDIAMDLQFSSSQHFSTSFRKNFSCSPRAYRQAFLEAHEKQSFLTAEEISSRTEVYFIRMKDS